MHVPLPSTRFDPSDRASGGSTFPASNSTSIRLVRSLKLATLWIMLCALPTSAAPCETNEHEREVWASGHGDLGLSYRDGQWSFTVRNADPDDILVQGGASARLFIPSSPAFSFLGQPGDPIWVLPQSQIADLPYLGLNAEGVAPGQFLGERVRLDLACVIGPGDFVMWTTGTGTVDVHMNARDGIAAEDVAHLPVLGHTHQNWGFTRSGIYELEFTATGTLVSGEPASTSDPVRVRFELLSPDPPSEPERWTAGHAELQVALEEGVWRLDLARTDPPSVHQPHEVQFEIDESMSRLVPDDPRFAFLGEPGQRVWILPQLPEPDAVSLSVSGARIDDGAIVPDSAQLRLIEIRGPGHVFAYQIQPDGEPVLWLSSRAESDAAGGIPLSSGEATAVHWAFTQPGCYKLVVCAVAQRANPEEPVRTSARILSFEVLPASPVPPALQLVALSPEDGFALRWNSNVGTEYQVESAAAIEGPWQEMGEPLAGTGGDLEHAVESTDDPHRFLRVRLVNP
jgi:surface-anchored protein